MYNVYPYSTIHGTIALRSTANRVNPRTRINNEVVWKESATMNQSLFIMDAHVQAVHSKRLQQARLAEQIRLARGQQPSRFSRIVTSFRQSTGGTLIALGQRLQRGHRFAHAARELEAMRVTRERAISSR